MYGFDRPNCVKHLPHFYSMMNIGGCKLSCYCTRFLLNITFISSGSTSICLRFVSASTLMLAHLVLKYPLVP